MSLQKKKLLQDLFEIVDRSREACDYHSKEITALEEFLKHVEMIVKEECPEFVERFEVIKNNFAALIEQEKELQSAELRTAEDLNDIAARFDVVYRVSEETSEKTGNVKRCTANIKALKEKRDNDAINGGKNQAKIEAEIQKAIEEKRKAVEEADLKLQEFIEVKERYNSFKVRRFQHAYNFYGSVLAKTMKEASSICDRIVSSCATTNEELDSLLDKGVDVTPAE